MADSPIPLIDIGAQYARLKDAIDARVHAVLDHGGFILGPELRELEAALAELGGVPHALGVASGTDALALPLIAAGIGPGDAVFMPSFSYVATATAVVETGAVPVFCDVEPGSLHLDPRDLERALDTLPDALTPRAVVPVDLFGVPADYAPIHEIAASRGLLVVADAAQSFGASRGGVPVGALAPVTATSFYPTKPLGCFGDGGAILTGDAAMADRLTALRVHGQRAGVTELERGLNSRLDTLQAAILLAKLDTFAADLDRRREIAALYDERLDGHVGRQEVPADAQGTVAVYAILSPERDAIRAALTEAGIGSRIYYERPIHRMPAMAAYHRGAPDLPVSDRLCTEALALPVFPEMTDDDVGRVCDVVTAALRANSAA